MKKIASSSGMKNIYKQQDHLFWILSPIRLSIENKLYEIKHIHFTTKVPLKFLEYTCYKAEEKKIDYNLLSTNIM